MPVTIEALPEFFQRSDKYAITWESRYLLGERVQLIALILATAVASVGSAPAVTIIFFAIALMAQLFRLTTKADERWWNGRAGAESAKRAGWLFMVGGAPFGVQNNTAESEFAHRLATIAEKVADLAPVPASSSHVTAPMEALRHEPLRVRVETYRVDRIKDQQKWYADKSEDNAKWAMGWALAGIASTALALIVGILCAINDWSFDAVGVFSALTASIAAWLGLKQHQILARSYAVASNELGLIEARINDTDWHEPAWEAFVNEAEEAISREHTSWRASRAL